MGDLTLEEFNKNVKAMKKAAENPQPQPVFYPIYVAPKDYKRTKRDLNNLLGEPPTSATPEAKKGIDKRA